MSQPSKKLTRSSQQRMLGGVCGGIAEYTGINVNIIRMAYILLSIFSAAFPGILVYLAAWVILPGDNKK